MTTPRAFSLARARLAPCALLLLAAGAGCGGDTAVDIALVPDPNINDRASLLARIQGVELSVDSDDGLYPAVKQVLGDLRIEDIDGDGDGDLIARVALPGDGRLPLVRLHRGGLPDVAIHLSVDGFDKNQSTVRIASGGVRGVRFAADEVTRIEVPFNIRPRYRPPRVTQLVPAPGTRNGQNTVGSIFVIFSKRMLRASIDGAAVGVYRVESGSAGELVASVQRNIQVIPGEDSPTTLEYRFANPLEPATYEVRVTADARDDTQRRLDQVPIQPGDQAYSARFVISDEPPQAAVPQQTPFDCMGASGCPPGSRCDGASNSCKLFECPASCEAGFVCSDAFHVCVVDCRGHGSYGGCDADKRCDSDSGLCVAL